MQQKQEQQQIINLSPEEIQQVIQKFIFILQNKQRIPKDKFQQKKNGDEEYHFDTLVEYKENSSQISSESSSTYISLLISDDDSRILIQILSNLQQEHQLQFSQYEKIQKGLSDFQNQYISHVIEPTRKINSDIVQYNRQEDSDDEKKDSNVKSKSKSNKNKILNAKQSFNSLKNLKTQYEKYLYEIRGTKIMDNYQASMKKLKEKQSKFINYQQTMQADRIIFEQCRQIIDESLQTFQQYDKEILDYKPAFNK